MTSQLSLITTGSTGSASVETTPDADRSTKPPGPAVDAGRTRPVSSISRLDRRTITRGQRGVAAARAELQEAVAAAVKAK